MSAHHTSPRGKPWMSWRNCSASFLNCNVGWLDYQVDGNQKISGSLGNVSLPKKIPCMLICSKGLAAIPIVAILKWTQATPQSQPPPAIANADTLPATPEELQSAGRVVPTQNSESGNSQKGTSVCSPSSPVPSVTSLGSQKDSSVLWHKYTGNILFFLNLNYLKM